MHDSEANSSSCSIEGTAKSLEPAESLTEDLVFLYPKETVAYKQSVSLL